MTKAILTTQSKTTPRQSGSTRSLASALRKPRGSDHARKGDLDEAIADLNEGIGLDPKPGSRELLGPGAN